MAIVVTGQLPGGTAAQDEEVMQALGLQQHPAAGALLRAAGPIPGGWQIVSVWESQEAFDTFRRERLMPVLQRLGRPAPALQVWPAASVLVPQR